MGLRALVKPQIEESVIEQLREYRLITGRIKMLERYPIGNGMYLSSFNQDDNLQQLHQKLRGLPSYMYLNKHEQKLETVANAYLSNHPLGTRAQLNEIRNIEGFDQEDQQLLKQLAKSVEKVLNTRRGTPEGIDAVIERVSELQDLQEKKEQIDQALDILEWHKPHYCKLLKLRYIEAKSVEEAAEEMSVSTRTFDRWRPKAIKAYARLIGIE
jgi:DNA-directed RNA polymerase specialized sigma subunit